MPLPLAVSIPRVANAFTPLAPTLLAAFSALPAPPVNADVTIKSIIKGIEPAVDSPASYPFGSMERIKASALFSSAAISTTFFTSGELSPLL